MKKEVQKLKQQAANVAALPIFSKVKPSEQLIVQLLALVEKMVEEIEELKEVQHGKS